MNSSMSSPKAKNLWLLPPQRLWNPGPPFSVWTGQKSWHLAPGWVTGGDAEAMGVKEGVGGDYARPPAGKEPSRPGVEGRSSAAGGSGAESLRGRPMTGKIRNRA